METFGDKKKGKKGNFSYVCDLCDFECCKKYSWDRHLLTPKHCQVTLGDALVTEKGQKGQKEVNYVCENCDKQYKSRNGLWKHKGIGNCHKNNCIKNDKNEIISMLVKQNTDLIKEQTDIKHLILEIVKNGTNNNTINTTNSHNKSFNLNFFLNETCKNAMNITDFVESITLHLSDLISIGDIGYVEGVSKIIVKNLNNLDETERPIHCTDNKRETFYIKDQNQWEKDDENKKKIKTIITNVINKNIKLLPKFREKYPDYGNSSSIISDTYNKVVVETMMCDKSKDDKIIRNISNATTIHK